MSLSDRERLALSKKVGQFSKSGRIDELKALLAPLKAKDRRAVINLPDKNGSTAVFHPVWPGHVECLELLCAYGANVNHQNLRLNTALHLACEQRHKDCVRVLIAHGASINMLNSMKRVCWEMLENDGDRYEIRDFVKDTKKKQDRRTLFAASGGLEKARATLIQTTFGLMDDDGDGYVHKGNVMEFLQAVVEDLGEDDPFFPRPIDEKDDDETKIEYPPPPEVSEDVFEAFFNWMDLDGDNRVDLEEFLNAINEYTSMKEAERLRLAKKKKKKKKKGRSKSKSKTRKKSRSRTRR